MLGANQNWGARRREVELGHLNLAVVMLVVTQKQREVAGKVQPANRATTESSKSLFALQNPKAPHCQAEPDKFTKLNQGPSLLAMFGVAGPSSGALVTSVSACTHGHHSRARL